MKEICRECKFEKKYIPTHCKCVKYGCPMKYEGRVWCISYEPKVQESQIRYGWDYVRQQEGSEPVVGTQGTGKFREDPGTPETDPFYVAPIPEGRDREGN